MGKVKWTWDGVVANIVASSESVRRVRLDEPAMSGEVLGGQVRMASTVCRGRDLLDLGFCAKEVGERCAHVG